MTPVFKYSLLFGGLFVVLLLLIILDLFGGSNPIPLSEFSSLAGGDQLSDNGFILHEFRVPRTVMAILAGGGLSLAGLLMQTLFNNPLAGPYVLGINSGSSLLVALCLLSGIPFFSTDLGVITGAIAGAAIMGMILLTFALFVRSILSLLLIGLMIGSFSGAFVSVLQSYSSAESLKVFTMWSLGSLQNTAPGQLPVILLFFITGILLTILLNKPLNALVLGEFHARNLGISVKRVRIVIIVVTALFTGLITAYCGPIAFVGLAVPNLVRILFRTQNHRVLLPGTLLAGSCFMLFCDYVIKLFENTLPLPVNALTSLIGAPFVVFLILKRRV